jgi:hypothetical protein
MMKSKVNSTKFILTASLGADSEDLKVTYQKLLYTYGPEAAKSTIVVITKPNMAGDYYEERLASTIKNCKELGLPYMIY